MSASAAAAEMLVSDAWLSRTLGVPAFALRLPLPQTLPAQLSRLPSKAFCFAKVPEADAASCAVLKGSGFSHVDTQVTLERSAGQPPAAPRVEVRMAEKADRNAVLDIAGSCFRFSRFHQDAKIGTQTAHAVKRAWAANCLDGQRGEEVLVALDGGRPAGFLAVLYTPEAAIIDLVAVAMQSQGRGIGAALVDVFIARWRDRAPRLRVGTQAANEASLCLYEGRGFVPVARTAVWHAHLQGGKPA